MKKIFFLTAKLCTLIIYSTYINKSDCEWFYLYIYRVICKFRDFRILINIIINIVSLLSYYCNIEKNDFILLYHHSRHYIDDCQFSIFNFIILLCLLRQTVKKLLMFNLCAFWQSV